MVIQDADLEYDPNDLPRLLRVATDGDLVAVYRKRPSHWNKPSRWFLASGVLLVDLVIAALHGTFVRDHATCYKLIRGGHKIVQVPIGYHPRAYDEGKKLTWTHGFAAVREA